MQNERALCQSVLNRFAAFISDGAFLDAAQQQEFPLAVVRPTGTVIIETPEECARDLETSWTAHASVGAVGGRCKITDMRSFAPSMFMVDCEWQLVDKNGQTVSRFSTTYGMHCADGRAQKTFVIAHNEILVRPIGIKADASE